MTFRQMTHSTLKHSTLKQQCSNFGQYFKQCCLKFSDIAYFYRLFHKYEIDQTQKSINSNFFMSKLKEKVDLSAKYFQNLFEHLNDDELKYLKQYSLSSLIILSTSDYIDFVESRDYFSKHFLENFAMLIVKGIVILSLIFRSLDKENIFCGLSLENSFYFMIGFICVCLFKIFFLFFFFWMK